MEKLKITCYGLDLYVDGDKNDEGRVGEFLKQKIVEVCCLKPDWYFKAKSRHALGLEC